ncbi:MAG: hypothetical protein QOE22_713 [Candidatus Parcubacteria bacterium]|jgi:outer membrane lipoprotein-sorting protein|nr:hypothetical protein [Candidatus Parcubacteria bacterium]
MTSLHKTRYALLTGATFLLIAFMPTTAEAATKKPSCTLTVTTAAGEAEITKEGDVIIREGGTLKIEWDSKNAQEAELDGEEVAESDSETFTPKRTTTYEFEFKNGSKKAACEVTANVIDGSVDDVTSGTKPALSGEVSGTKKVNVAIYQKNKKVFEKKNISVKRGEWEAKVTKALKKGEYEVRLTGDKSYDLNGIATATLTIGDKNTVSGGGSSKGVLSVTTIPLLAGGTTRAGATVPVAYLQLRNTGTEAVQVTGFTVKQNGTASGNVITSLSTSDDKGGSRGASAMNPFTSGSAFAPTDAKIEPGAMKLFTIKAMLGTNAIVGTNLMLDVTGVEGNGTEKGAFPLRGTTWAIGY